MPLIELIIEPSREAIPKDVREFIHEADARIDEYQQRNTSNGFVPADYEFLYRYLHALADSTLIRGMRFCEWGSGYGALTMLASMLGYEAYGIEIEDDLVRLANVLAEDYDLDCVFASGSYLPHESEAFVHELGQQSWLHTEADNSYAELDLDVDDFDLIYVYPWPDEEPVSMKVFERFAAEGAVLMTYHGGENVSFKRKKLKRRR